MKRLAIALGLATALAPAVHAGVWINPGFYTHHFDNSLNLNDYNHGFGVEADIAEGYSVTAGVYQNSNRTTSHYVGTYVMPFRDGAFKAGVAVGAINGYTPMRNGGWFPAAVPTMTFESQHYGLNVSFIPKIGDRVNSALTFQLKFKLLP